MTDATMPSPEPMAEPFGAYAPRGLDARLIAWTRRLPAGWAGKRLAFALRKLVLRRRRTPLDLDVFGGRMRLYPHDNIAERRVAFTPQYFDAAERAVLAAVLRPGDVFVDIGANAGVYSLFAANRIGPAGRVLAIEADPFMFRRLSSNIALNPEWTILAENIAAAGEAGTLSFYVNTRNRGQNSLVVATGNRIEVPAEPLLAILRRRGFERIDALKIDVEGAEHSILQPFFRDAPRDMYPRLIVAENNADPARLLPDLLEGVGYRLVRRTKGNLIYELADATTD